MQTVSQWATTSYFYPRSPRGERPVDVTAEDGTIKFLSTLPARGATGRHRGRHPVRHHFYPRSPRGERLAAACAQNNMLISIHAPREGSDTSRPRLPASAWRFLSTLPARGATAPHHAARGQVQNFYPRSPRGERPVLITRLHRPRIFLSTLPARGATSTGAIS